MQENRKERNTGSRAAGSEESLKSDSPFDSAAEMLAIALSCWSVQIDQTVEGGYWWQRPEADSVTF